MQLNLEKLAETPLSYGTEVKRGDGFAWLDDELPNRIEFQGRQWEKTYTKTEDNHHILKVTYLHKVTPVDFLIMKLQLSCYVIFDIYNLRFVNTYAVSLDTIPDGSAPVVADVEHLDYMEFNEQLNDS